MVTGRWELRMCILLAILSCVMGSGRAQVKPAPGERIVFLSNRDTSEHVFGLWCYDVRSASATNLTKGHPELRLDGGSSPRIARKRNSVIFFSSGERRLMELSFADGAVRTIAGVRYEAGTFDLSRDNRSLVYVEKIDSVLQIVRIDLTDGSTKTLTHSRANNFEPSLSPDGKKVTYVSDEGGTNSIFIMDADGSHQRRLTNEFGDDRQPKFSPDGERIVFVSSRGGTTDADYEVYTIGPAGTRCELFYESMVYESHPMFTPDNRYVVFESRNALTNSGSILMKNIKTGIVTDCSAAMPPLNQNCSVSADGRVLVFEHTTFNECGIILFDIAHRKAVTISKHKAWDCAPSF